MDEQGSCPYCGGVGCICPECEVGDELDTIREFQEDRNLTPEQAEALRNRLYPQSIYFEPPSLPVVRLPKMSERERIDTGYVHVSHATRHLFPRGEE